MMLDGPFLKGTGLAGGRRIRGRGTGRRRVERGARPVDGDDGPRFGRAPVDEPEPRAGTLQECLGDEEAEPHAAALTRLAHAVVAAVATAGADASADARADAVAA